MSIIGIQGSEQSGIFEAHRDEGALMQRTGLLSAYMGGVREKAAARMPGSSDSVLISETAMLLAAGILTPDTLPTGSDGAGSFQANGKDSTGLYSSAGYNAFAQARIAARLARNEAAAASMALLAPLPPGGDDSDGPAQTLRGNRPSSSVNAAFSIARLQNRLRELQLELSTLEGGDMSDQGMAVQVHSLTNRITQTMQDISGLRQRAGA